jgi:hypothetical protein
MNILCVKKPHFFVVLSTSAKNFTACGNYPTRQPIPVRLACRIGAWILVVCVPLDPFEFLWSFPMLIDLVYHPLEKFLTMSWFYPTLALSLVSPFEP